MLSLLRTPGSMFRGIAGQSLGAHFAKPAKTGVAMNFDKPRADAIFNSSTRKSDQEVLANVLAQL
ncbi:MAG: hypothetical protein ACJA06_000218 [Halocynthiibacter sp.]|jgi:hypothetical protein